MIDPYSAVCIQPEVNIAFKRKEIMKNVDRCVELIDAAAMWNAPIGVRTRLVGFPEAFLHGTGMGADIRLTLKDMLDVSIPIPGEETDRFAERAKADDLFIVGHTFELIEDWHNRYFSTVFVISPEGKVIMKYRKVNVSNNSIELATSPHAVLDKYMEKYGKGKTISETLFPVAKTEIGNIGCYVCYDGHFPEVARCLALNGAEVLVRPTAYMEPFVGYNRVMDAWEFGNRCRAWENRCYVVAPNIGEWKNAPHMPHMWDPGHAMIVDPDGKVLCEGNPGENMIGAVIDVEWVRRIRKQIGMNHLAQITMEAYADAYKRSIFPPNTHYPKSAETLPEIWSLIKNSAEKLYFDIYGEKVEASPIDLTKMNPLAKSPVYPEYKPAMPWKIIVDKAKEVFGK